MIASCIALVIWASGLTYLAYRDEQHRVLHADGVETGSIEKTPNVDQKAMD